MPKEVPKAAIFCSVTLTRPRCYQANELECIAMQCPSPISRRTRVQRRGQIARHTNWLIFCKFCHLLFTSFSTKFLMDNCVVFDASHNKQHIDIHMDALVIDVSELEIIDTTKGARLIPGSEADTSLFMLVPREEVVGSGKRGIAGV